MGPFLYFNPMNKRNNKFLLFVPNFTPNPPSKKDKICVINTRPHNDGLPTITLMSPKMEEIKRLYDNMINAMTDICNFMFSAKVNQNIQGEFEQFSEDIAKPINVLASIQMVTGRRFQALYIEKAQLSLDVLLGQGNPIVSPCIEVPHKLGSNDDSCRTFFLIHKERSLPTYFKTANVSMMAKWILFIHIYANQINKPEPIRHTPSKQPKAPIDAKSRTPVPVQAKSAQSTDNNNNNNSISNNTNTNTNNNHNNNNGNDYNNSSKIKKDSDLATPAVQNATSSLKGSEKTKNILDTLSFPSPPATKPPPPPFKPPPPPATKPQPPPVKPPPPKENNINKNTKDENITSSNEIKDIDITFNNEAVVIKDEDKASPTLDHSSASSAAVPSTETTNPISSNITNTTKIESSDTIHTDNSISTNNSINYGSHIADDHPPLAKQSPPKIRHLEKSDSQRSSSVVIKPEPASSSSAQSASSGKSKHTSLGGKPKSGSSKHIGKTSSKGPVIPSKHPFGSKGHSARTSASPSPSPSSHLPIGALQQQQQLPKTHLKTAFCYPVEQPKNIEIGSSSSQDKKNGKDSNDDDDDFTMMIESIHVEEIEDSPQIQVQKLRPPSEMSKNNSNNENTRNGNGIEGNASADDLFGNNEEIDDNYDIPADSRFQERLKELDQRMSNSPKIEVFEPPNFDKLLQATCLTMASMVAQNTRSLQLKSLMDMVNVDDLEIVNFPFDDIPDDEIVQGTLDSELSSNELVDLSLFFNFKEFPEYDKSQLKASQPINPFLEEFRYVDEGLRMMGTTSHDLSDPYCLRLCFLTGCILLNGLRDFTAMNSTTSLAEPLTELSEVLYDLKSFLPEIGSDQTTAQQASIAATMLIKKNLLGVFLREVKRSDEWAAKYYLPSAMLTNYEFLDTFCLMIEPVINTQTFGNVEMSTNIFKISSQEDFGRYALTPLFAYLEIEDLINENLDQMTQIRLIARQFEVGLKKKSTFVQKSPWDVLIYLTQQTKDAPIWPDFVNSIANCKGGFGRAASKLESWIGESIDKHMVHIWVLLIIVNRKELSEFYYPEASLVDPYRVDFITKRICYFILNKH